MPFTFQTNHIQSNPINHMVDGTVNYRTYMANSALKCQIIILIIATSFCSYNNILIIIRHI